MMRFPENYSLCFLAVMIACQMGLAATQERKKMCLTANWRCGKDGCIGITRRCDGERHCADKSDEENCEQWTCPSDYWKCSNHKCIKLSWRCDGRNNCGDNSDEENCGRLRIDCPSYVMERSSVTCTCGAKMKQPHNVTWPGHSQSGSLTLTNVQRSDNGTQYTCLLTADGVREEAVYTLRVAYGPYKKQVSISPSNLVRNGTQPVTLTCNANNTYPPPYYEWEGVPCQKRTAENTCTFVIDPTNENVEATCRVESVTLSDRSQELHKNVLGTASVKQRATITFLPDCGEDFAANSSEQYFQSPGYPRRYAKSLYCAWHITAPKGHVLWLYFVNMRISRRCREAYVTIYEGDETTGRKFWDYCLGSSTRFQTTSGLLTVTFRSNDQTSDRSYNGFRAVFKTIPNCGGNIHVNGSIQTIQSPGYPVKYLDNMECVWTITASRGSYILFNFTDFEVENGRDYVQLRDGKNVRGELLRTWSGGKEYRSKAKFKPMTSYSNKATIIFSTNKAFTLKGFNLEIQATKTIRCPNFKCNNSRCVWNKDRCNGRDNCGDRSDEDNCDSCQGYDTRKCSNTRQCITRSDRCNGEINCSDGSDEQNCVRCAYRAWKCSKNTKCITASQRCDGNTDCADGSDERKCGNDNNDDDNDDNDDTTSSTRC